MNIIAKVCVLLLGLFGLYGVSAESVQGQESKLPGEVRGRFRGKDVKLYRGGGDLSKYIGQPKKAPPKQQRAPKYKPEDICLDFHGDALTWKTLDEHVELQLLDSPLSIPPEATAQQVQDILASSKIRLQEILVNGYLKNAVLAYVARTNGLKIAESELAVALSNSVRKVAGKKHGAEIVPKLMAKGSYFYRNQENYLLTKKYIGEVLTKNVEITPAQIEELKSQRLKAIEGAKEKNAQLRPRIEGLLAEIKSGKRDFGETAWEFSDCGSSQDNGDLGEFEQDCSLLKPLKDFIFAPSEQVLSDVIETPYSYHIVKILRRSYDADDLDAEDEKDAGKDEQKDDEKGEEKGNEPERTSAPTNILPILVVLGVATVALSGVFLIFLPRTRHLHVIASGTVLIAGAVAGVLVYVNRTIPVPTKVRVAHIMLEKEEVPPMLDDAAAREELTRQTIGRRTVGLQERLIESAQKSRKLKCAVRMTLLNRKKALEKKKAQESKKLQGKKKGNKQ